MIKTLKFILQLHNRLDFNNVKWLVIDLFWEGMNVESMATDWIFDDAVDFCNEPPFAS